MKRLVLATILTAFGIGTVAVPAPVYAADRPGYVARAPVHVARQPVYVGGPPVYVTGGPAFDMPPGTFTSSPIIIWNPFPPDLAGYTYRH